MEVCFFWWAFFGVSHSLSPCTFQICLVFSPAQEEGGEMKARPRKCPCCEEWFQPDPHNAYHQKYCSRRPCQAARQHKSRRKWQKKNRDYHCGKEHVLRVQLWRIKKTGKRRGKNPPSRGMTRMLLADLFLPLGQQKNRGMRVKFRHLKSGVLQEVLIPQVPGSKCVVLKLVCVLQEVIRFFFCKCYLSRKCRRCPD